jgi:uncharacterized protein (TIGR02145 family)
MKTRILLITMMVISSLMVNAQTIMNIHQSNGTVLQIPLNTIDSITYTINNPGNLATISTLSIGNITSSSATSGGNITNNGGTTVTQSGVVWSAYPNPTLANNSTVNGSGTGSYTSSLTGLTASTTYYVRAYATNSAGTAYGNELSFTSSAGGGGIVTNPGAGVTFDGYAYASIVLGNGQEWLAENLRTTVYANGDPIPNVTDQVQFNNSNTGAWANYNNDIQNDNPYGKLYNWYAVADPRNACPNGWHVPSDAEWNSLIGYLDPLYLPNFIGTQSAIAGGKMKSIGTLYWPTPNQNATNEIGFSGLPGGTSYGAFSGIGLGGYWWGSTQLNASSGYSRIIFSSGDGIKRQNSYKGSGHSVRCLRD